MWSSTHIFLTMSVKMNLFFTLVLSTFYMNEDVREAIDSLTKEYKNITLNKICIPCPFTITVEYETSKNSFIKQLVKPWKSSSWRITDTNACNSDCDSIPNCNYEIHEF